MVFQICSPTEKGLSSPKYAANVIKIGLEKPMPRLVEVIHYVIDTVEGRQRDKHKKHHILSPHTDVCCSISANLCMMLEEVRVIISPECFFGCPVNSSV